MNRAKLILDLNDYQIIKHSTGRLRFAVWDKDEILCWCANEVDARHVVQALITAEYE